MMGVEAARVILGAEGEGRESGVGVLTPAVLGMGFVESLKGRGVDIEVEKH